MNILALGGGIGAAVLVFLIYQKMFKPQGSATGKGVKTPTQTFRLLMHTLAGRVKFVRARYVAGMFLVPTIGGFLEMEGHKTYVRRGRIWVKKLGIPADAQRARLAIYSLRQGDGRPLDYSAGPEKGYVGRRVGQHETRAVLSRAGDIAQDQAVREGNVNEQISKNLVRAVVFAVVCTVVMFAVTYYLVARNGGQFL